MNCDEIEEATSAQCLAACDFGNYTYEKILTFETSKLYCYCDDLDVTVCNEDYMGTGLLVITIIGAVIGVFLLFALIVLCDYYCHNFVKYVKLKREERKKRKTKEQKLKDEIDRLNKRFGSMEDKLAEQLQEMVEVNIRPHCDIKEYTI